MAGPSRYGGGSNALLGALSEGERAVIAPALEHVPLNLRDVVQQAERPLPYVLFPSSGVLSAVSKMENGAVVELATIGREGFAGIPLVLASDQMAHDIFVQVPGEADRIKAGDFRRLLGELPGLQTLVLRYTLAFVTAVAQGSACNRLHPVEARCARWLLLTHDRVDGDVFPLTQEFLGDMLGVTRPSVSIAAGMLQKAGLIRYVRGVITVLDRPGLEQASCECYKVITREFERVFGRAV